MQRKSNSTDVFLLGVVAFAAAPTIWLAFWFFTIYLSTASPSESGLTELEKWDTLTGLMPLAITISVLVTPIVMAMKSLSAEWKERNRVNSESPERDGLNTNNDRTMG